MNLRELIHGVEVADPYRWLEDPISDETRAWLAAQRDYTSRILDTPIRPSLRTRLALIMQVDEIGVPIVRNGSYFYARRFADRQQPVICHRSGHAGVERILIDPQISSSDSFTSAEIQAVSNDGKLVAYGLRRGGEDELEIRVLEVRGERELVDLLPRGRYFNLAWNHQGSGFYYFVHTGEKSCVRFHRLGTLPHADTEVFEASPDRGIRLHATYDGRYLILTVIRGGSGSPTDLYFLALGRDERAVPIVTDTDSVYEPAYVGDALVLHTNLEAPNWRVMRVSFADPRRASWSEIVSERAAPMQSLAAVGGRLFLSYLEDVRSRIRIVDINGSSLGEIDLPAAGTAGPLMGGWQDPEAFFSFSSFNVPPTVFRFEVSSGVLDQWSRAVVPYDFEGIDSRQVWFTSKDGTRVPMFVSNRRDIAADGNRPTLLLGYGGFNESYSPFCWPLALVWMQAGGVFAVANLRGGGEFGERWHRAGQFELKQNVFDDFAAAAEYLVSTGWTSPDDLAAIGASNGGLLVGAAITQRPELFRAAISWAPLLDMVRYTRHPLGSFWISEFGSPDDSNQFAYLYAYSPYHHVEEGQNYPAVMFLTGEADTRCDPMHARKMAAAMQWASRSAERPIILHHRLMAGHMASLPIDAAIDEAADQLAFLFRELRITQLPF